jgi:hypothetical protein
MVINSIMVVKLSSKLELHSKLPATNVYNNCGIVLYIYISKIGTKLHVLKLFSVETWILFG